MASYLDNLSVLADPVLLDLGLDSSLVLDSQHMDYLLLVHSLLNMQFLNMHLAELHSLCLEYFVLNSVVTSEGFALNPFPLPF